MNAYIIGRVESIFRLSRKRYEKINLEHSLLYKYELGEKSAEIMIDEPSGLRSLLTMWVFWRKTQKWEDEVDDNLKSGNDSYFKYLENSFNKQYHFLQGFDEALSLYKSNYQQALRLLNSLDEGIELSQAEFQLAIQIYYIDIYQILEEYVSSIYHQFRPNFLSNGYFGKKSQSKVFTKNTNYNFRTTPPFDCKIKELYTELMKHNFISGATIYKSFKHIILQKNLEDRDLIFWSDKSDSKYVDKITLLEFVSTFVIGDSKIQNAFIIKFFRLVEEKDTKSITTLESLKNSRRTFYRPETKNKRLIQIKQLIKSALGG